MGLVRQIPPQPRQRRDPRRVDEHRSHNLQPPDTKPRPEPAPQVRAHVRSNVAVDDRVPVDIARRLVPKYFVRQAAPIQPTEPVHNPRTRKLEDEENNKGRPEAQDRRMEPPLGRAGAVLRGRAQHLDRGAAAGDVADWKRGAVERI